MNDLSQLGTPGSDECGPTATPLSRRAAVPIRVEMDGQPLKARLISAGRGATLVSKKVDLSKTKLFKSGPSGVDLLAFPPR